MNDIYIESMLVKNPERLSVEVVLSKTPKSSAFKENGYINIAVIEADNEAAGTTEVHDFDFFKKTTQINYFDEEGKNIVPLDLSQ
jgi:hypothetical protein